MSSPFPTSPSSMPNVSDESMLFCLTKRRLCVSCLWATHPSRGLGPGLAGTHLSLLRLPPLAAPGGSASTPKAHRRASLWRTTECCPLQPQRNTYARVDHFRQGQLSSHRTTKITGKITWFNLCSFNRKSNWLSDTNHDTFSINCGSP